MATQAAQTTQQAAQDLSWVDHLNGFVYPYVYGPVVFILWVTLLWLIKRLLIYRLRKWTEKTAFRWGSILIESLSFPINFLIFASGITLLTNLFPLPDKVEALTTIALQGSIIFAIISFLDRLIKGLMTEYAQKGVLGHVSQGIAQGLIRGFVIGIGVLIFLDLIGISITPILASLGIGSLAVALALQDTLSNFFAGLYVAVDRPVQIGDLVKLESGQEGYVIDIGWRSTRIRALPNHVVIIPNSKLMGSVITNYDLPDKEVAVTVEVGVHYDSDLARVEKVTLEVAKEVMKGSAGGVASFNPLVLYHTFDDSSINFTVVLRSKDFDRAKDVKHEFIKRLHERYRKEGIVIPFPTRTLELSKESCSGLSEYLKRP